MKNVFEIYEHLYKASDNIKGESIDYNRGFQDAVYLLKYALTKFEHINLHTENRELRRKLLITDLNFDDSMFTITKLKSENKGLKEQLSEFKQIKKKIGDDLDGLTKCIVEIFDGEFDFYASIEQEEFDLHLPKIGEYIYERLHKGRRKGKPKHSADYKVWTLQYLRDKGIKCIA